MELRTDLPQCVLRPWAPSDKARLVQHANDRAVWRNLLDSFPHPYTEADADSWIAHNQAHPGLHFAITVGGAAVGGIGVIPQSGVSVRTAHFGYWLGRDAWGRGFATASARAMVAYDSKRCLCGGWRHRCSRGTRLRCASWRRRASRTKAFCARACSRTASSSTVSCMPSCETSPDARSRGERRTLAPAAPARENGARSHGIRDATLGVFVFLARCAN